MNKIRVIDLLNKIAKGEEVPNKIKYKGTTYEKDNDGDIDFYIGEDSNGTLFLEELDNTNELNDEIEIIEEEKDIEELTLKGKEIGYGIMSEWLDFTPNNNEQKICSAIESIGLKINELVRAFNEIKKEGK